MTQGVFAYPGGVPELKTFKLGSTDPTVVAGDASKRTNVAWLQCTEIAGSTPALSIEIYNGTTSTYLRYALAMSAKGSVLLEMGIPLPAGSYVRVTASAANQVDVVVCLGLPSKYVA